MGIVFIASFTFAVFFAVEEETGMDHMKKGSGISPSLERGGRS